MKRVFLVKGQLDELEKPVLVLNSLGPGCASPPFLIYTRQALPFALTVENLWNGCFWSDVDLMS